MATKKFNEKEMNHLRASTIICPKFSAKIQ